MTLNEALTIARKVLFGNTATVTDGQKRLAYDTLAAFHPHVEGDSIVFTKEVQHD